MNIVAADVPAWRMPTLTLSAVRLLAVDVPARQVAALRADRAYAHVEVIEIDAVACTHEAFAHHRPHAVLVPIWRLSAVTPLAKVAGVPVVALNLRAQAVDWTLSALRDVAAITAVDIASDPRATLETALRVAARARTDGAAALVLPGPADLIEQAQQIAFAHGLRTVACRSMASFRATMDDLAPVVLFSGPWVAEEAMAQVEEARLTHAFALVSLGRDPRERLTAADVVWEPSHDNDDLSIAMALNNVRRQRVLAQRHAATDLLLPAPMATACATLFAHGAIPPVLSVAVIRDTGEHRADSHALWASECRRVAVAARASSHEAIVGYDEDDSLVVAMPLSVVAIEQFVRSVLPPQRGVSWTAGVADVASTRARDYNYLRTCAREALTRDDVAVVRAWQHDTTRATPEVVIVEPDMLLAEMLQYGLRSLGHSCRAIDTGNDALDVLRRMPPTPRPVLVVTDVDLAGLDGHSLHERLRVERPGAFEFVFLTNHAAEGEQLRALDAGARDYLIKPISVRVLLARLTRLLSRN
ncbi:MAG: response regulator transcription factor [Gemmatimonadaceae bacterium]|nr:response regulator transcription factor [Gemmatimonadaceae bacterium]